VVRCRALTTVVAGITHSEQEVEAVTEADGVSLTGLGLGSRPAVNAGNVVQKRRRRANEAARLSRAVTRRVWARLAVAMLAIICWLGCAAMRSIWALGVNALHQALHGVASAVATCRGDATHMALARGLEELVAARRTHHMSNLTLHNNRGLIQQVNRGFSRTCFCIGT
jgi:hypothetical protein